MASDRQNAAAPSSLCSCSKIRRHPHIPSQTAVGSHSRVTNHTLPTELCVDETYLLAGIKLLGQLLYVVFSIWTPQSGRAHAVMGGHHLWQQKINTLIHV